MIRDHESQSDELSDSGRWDQYSIKVLDFLRNEGLSNFRSTRAKSKDDPRRALYSFGATDLNVSENLAASDSLFAAAFTSFAGKNAVSIRELEASTVGNPEGFTVENRFYTLSWLNFYCRYAYVSRFIDFEEKTVVEVGPGAGKQAELLKKAHPSLTIVLFDLPTQLYVCHQYLSKVFEGEEQVVGYRDTRHFQNFSDIVPGKINILPHWKFDIVKSAEFDLLWNAASFQEMDIKTASRYLTLASGAHNMYSMHNIKYRPNVSPPGLRGVTSEEYMPQHSLIDRELARLSHMPPNWIYFDSLWGRKE